MNINIGIPGISPVIDTFSMKQRFFKECKVDNILYPNLDELAIQILTHYGHL